MPAAVAKTGRKKTRRRLREGPRDQSATLLRSRQALRAAFRLLSESIRKFDAITTGRLTDALSDFHIAVAAMAEFDLAALERLRPCDQHGLTHSGVHHGDSRGGQHRVTLPDVDSASTLHTWSNTRSGLVSFDSQARVRVSLLISG